MVYCDLVSVEQGEAHYLMGGRPDDMTGELLVNLESGLYQVLKEPERSKVYHRHLAPLAVKAADAYKMGVIKERLSYEIG